LTDALVLPTTDGLVYFYLLGNVTGVAPQLYRFDFEVRIKALKVGPLRLYGRESEAKQCLIVSTHDDYTFVFYEFKFEVNT
jgi:hypothetical protein